MKLSAYTKFNNAESLGFPWKESILSCLPFCDEVIALDSGSTDNTYEILLDMAKQDSKIKPYQIKKDHALKGFSFETDGKQKTEARRLCSGDWCLQMDSDEVIHEDDGQKLLNVIKQAKDDHILFSTAFIEYWGDEGKVRGDIFPIKNRLSRNLPFIEHGIPKNQRIIKNDGSVLSMYSDGCCYIDNRNGYNLPSSALHDDNFYIAHQLALKFPSNHRRILDFKTYFDSVISNNPVIHHYSWFNLSNKIKQYKNYWVKHWADLYGKDNSDIAENNFFFNKPWSEVTEEDINNLAKRMKKELGGWLPQKHIDFEEKMPSIQINRNHPKVVQDWVLKNTKL